MWPGLNFNCVEGVIPTCTSPENPPKYEPISCGDVSILEPFHAAGKLIRLSGVNSALNSRQSVWQRC